MSSPRAMLGAYRARVDPVNVNYRYVADELVYLAVSTENDVWQAVTRTFPRKRRSRCARRLP
jgi:hypothetical protein